MYVCVYGCVYVCMYVCRGEGGGPDLFSKDENDNVLHDCNFLVTICVVLCCR